VDQTGFYFTFVNTKLPIVAKSAWEAELIPGSQLGDLYVWPRELLSQLGLFDKCDAEETSMIGQDKKSTILTIQ
jgi:hypothetical protein